MGNHFTKCRIKLTFKNYSEQQQKVFDRAAMAETEQSSMDDSTNNITIPTTKREFHNVQTSTYWLPKDDSEQMRLSAVR